jgi:PAS domain-containing protein
MIKEKVFTPKLAPDPQIILDSTNDLIVAFDKDYQVVYCNQSFKKNFEIFASEQFSEDKPLTDYLGLSRFNDLKNCWLELLDKGFEGESSKRNH